MRLSRVAVALLALLAIGAGWRGLHGASDGLSVTSTTVGDIPATVFRRDGAAAAPVVVIAHGFAGSQQLMLAFAITLARNGYVAVTFDFAGHGRNPRPLPGGLSDDKAASAALLGDLGAVVDQARTLPGSDGRVALLGHSMASDIVVRYAMAHPDIAATVAVSLFGSGITATNPRDLLVIVGALEPAMLTDEAFRVVGLASSGPVKPRTTYGDFDLGTARRMSLSGGVEHIGVLFSRQSLAEALAWYDTVFHRSGDGYLNVRGPDLALLFGGLVALAWPLSRLLPRVSPVGQGAGVHWPRLLLPALGPALLTPLLLWRLPTHFLPVLLGDYLVVHFAVYGALTAIFLWLMRAEPPQAPRHWGRLAIAALAVAAYSIGVIGHAIDADLTSFMPIAGRLPLIAAMLLGTLPYFIADEWATRGAAPARGGYAATKLCFLVSLMLAVALNPPRLFFLIIIIPVMLIFFLVFGLFSRWAYRRTLHPLVGALANAAAFAWAIAVVFPVVG